MGKLKELFWPPTKKDFVDYLESQPFYKGPMHFITMNIVLTALFYLISWTLVANDSDFLYSPRTQTYARTGMFIFPIAVYILFVRETKKFLKSRSLNEIRPIDKEFE